MIDHIKNEMDLLKRGLESSQGRNHDEFRDEHLFGGVCVKYFYHISEIGVSEWNDSFCDGARDHGIDWICVNHLDGGNKLHIIQSKYVSTSPSAQDVKAMLTKMVDGREAILQFSENASERVKMVMQQQTDNFASLDDIEWVFSVFLGSSFSEAKRQEVMDEMDDEVSFEIFDSSEIADQILSRQDSAPHVVEGKVKIFKEQGAIEVGEYGRVVNLSAKSLQELYRKTKTKGLFAQNFREFVAKKSVDQGIQSSILDEKERFWERNNGLIITCDESHLDGDTLKLYNFSIVNGCQTTSLIGKSKNIEEQNDFPVICKVITAKEPARIDAIAEASNSQKAINIQDLKANTKEQKILHNRFLSNQPRVDIVIKRGIKERNVDRRLSNKLLGQLILTCILQKPGKARTNSRLIFENKELYSSIFKRKYDVQAYYDLIRLHDVYDAWVKNATNVGWGSLFPGLDDANLTIRGALAKNGKWVILASTVFLVKHLTNGESLQENMKNIHADWKLPEFLLKKDRPDDWENQIHHLWSSMIAALHDVYDGALSAGKTNAPSNLTKTDDNYVKLILPKLIRQTIEGYGSGEEFKSLVRNNFTTT